MYCELNENARGQKNAGVMSHVHKFATKYRLKKSNIIVHLIIFYNDASIIKF